MDQNFVGYYSHLFYFFDSKVVEQDFCLSLDSNFNTIELDILLESIFKQLAKSTVENNSGAKVYKSYHVHAIVNGIKYLYQRRESMGCPKQISCCNKLARFEWAEVNRLFDQVYGVVMHQCWFEVQRYWLDYITNRTKKVVHVFWRDEFQEKCGNLPHIYGVVAMDLTY